MSAILAATILSLTAPLLTPTLVASNQDSNKPKSAVVETGTPDASRAEFMKALLKGQLTKPGRTVDTIGQSQK
jgi:hypothetical protein